MNVTGLNRRYQTEKSEESAKYMLQILEYIKRQEASDFWPITKITIESIVFMQDSDYPERFDDMSDDDIIDYLFQWHYPGEHDTNDYNVVDINTGYLGYTRIINGQIFLFSHNSNMGYAGLSRIIGIVE